MAPSRYDGITLVGGKDVIKGLRPAITVRAPLKLVRVDDRTRDAVDRRLSGDISIIRSSVIETAFRLEEKMDRRAVNAHSEVAEQTKNSDRR
jgi:hypothetical protein